MAENILTKTKPQFPWIIFGDGHSAEVRRVDSVKLENGLNGYRFLMRPSMLTIKYYNLKPGINMTQDGFVTVTYPRSLIWKLRDDPTYGRWLAYCTFKGKPTSFSRREFYYTNEINAYERMMHILQTENAVLYDRLKMMASKHNIYYKDVVELFREIGKVKGDYHKKDTDDGDDND